MNNSNCLKLIAAMKIEHFKFILHANTTVDWTATIVARVNAELASCYKVYTVDRGSAEKIKVNKINIQ